MTEATLTDAQRHLLQRWFDGEADPAQSRRAEALVESSEPARTYVASLEELQGAARLAFGELARPTGLPDPADVVQAAVDAPPLVDEPLEELAGLLERHHDGEVTEAERAVVGRLRRRREDVEHYLDRLDELGDAARSAARAAREDVSFDSLWQQVSQAIDEQDRPPQEGAIPSFDPQLHSEWLHRYADGELSAERARIVEAWKARGHEEVCRTLASLEELNVAAHTAMREAVERADLDGLWGRVEAGIRDSEAASGDDVVSLDQARGARAEENGPEDAQTSKDGSQSTEVGWLNSYRYATIGAVAAAMLLVAFAALFGERIFEAGQAIDGDSVVIVDSVEYGSGASVLVDGPMEGFAAKDDDSTDKPEEKPTVIWLLDSESKDSDGEQSGAPQPAAKPSPSPDAGTDADDGEPN